jgi:hypothetical protein
MSMYAVHAIVVTSLECPRGEKSINIDEARRKALECGCNAVTEIVGSDELGYGNFSFLVGPMGNFISRGPRDVAHEAFIEWLQRVVDPLTNTLDYAEICFSSDLGGTSLLRCSEDARDADDDEDELDERLPADPDPPYRL